LFKQWSFDRPIGYTGLSKGQVNMVSKAKLIDVLDYSLGEVRHFVEELSPEQRAETGTVEHWSAKDVLAHFTEWTARLVNDLELIAANDEPSEPPSVGESDDDANAKIFAHYQYQSWDEVITKAERTQLAVRAYALAATEQELNESQPVPWREARPLWRTLVGSAVEHTILHLGYYQIGKGNQAGAARLQQTLASRMLDLDDSPSWRGAQIYNLACIEALTGNRDTALTHLAEALRLAPELIEWSKEDQDLAGLRQDPAYEALYAS
jgi:hypothetical protein